MKRFSDINSEREKKVIKLDRFTSVQFEAAREWTSNDLCSNRKPDEHAHIRVKVSIKYPIQNGSLCYGLILMHEKPPVQFDVHFTGNLVKHPDLLSLDNRDELLILLKGAHIKRLQSSNRKDLRVLPVFLVYREGVVVQIVASEHEKRVGKTINTWTSKLIYTLVWSLSWLMTPSKSP